MPVQKVPDGYASDKCDYGENAGRHDWQSSLNARNLNSKSLDMQTKLSISFLTNDDKQ